MAEVVSNTIKPDKTRVGVGEPVNFTGSVRLSETVKLGQLYVEIYVNDFAKPVKTLTEDISGGSATYSFSLVFREPGTYRVKTYAELYYLPYMVIVSVANSLDHLVVIDRSSDEYIWFDAVNGTAHRMAVVPVHYTVSGYPDKTVCSTIRIYNNDRLLVTRHACSGINSYAVIDLYPYMLRPGTLVVEAVPDTSGVRGYRAVYSVLDIGSVRVVGAEGTGDEIVIDVEGLPALPSDTGLWYEVVVGKTDPELGFIQLAEARLSGSDTGPVRVVIKRHPGQGCICVNTVRIRLCYREWSPTTCAALLKEIRFRDVCTGPLCG